VFVAFRYSFRFGCWIVSVDRSKLLTISKYRTTLAASPGILSYLFGAAHPINQLRNCDKQLRPEEAAAGMKHPSSVGWKCPVAAG
jgi:hypothetical protein